MQGQPVEQRDDHRSPLGGLRDPERLQRGLGATLDARHDLVRGRPEPRPAGALEVDLELRDRVDLGLGHDGIHEPVDRLLGSELRAGDLGGHGVDPGDDAVTDHLERGGDEVVERGEEVARRGRRHARPRRDRPVRRPGHALLRDDLDRGLEERGAARLAAGPVGGWTDRHTGSVPRLWTFVQR